MTKLKTFEVKPGQKMKNAIKRAVALVHKNNAPMMFKFDNVMQFLLTPTMETHEIMSMYHKLKLHPLKTTKEKTRTI